MNESIFRVLSLLIATGGTIAFMLSHTETPDSPDLITVIIVLTAFLLFAIGGSKLLSNLPFLKCLNEDVKRLLAIDQSGAK